MKKSISFLITILLAVSCFAQPGGRWLRPNNSFGTQLNGGVFDSALLVPSGCGAPTSFATRYVLRVDRNVRRAAQYVDTCSNRIYNFSPSDSSWKVVNPTVGSDDGSITITSVGGTNVNLSTNTSGSPLQINRVIDFGDKAFSNDTVDIIPNIIFYLGGLDTITTGEQYVIDLTASGLVRTDAVYINEDHELVYIEGTADSSVSLPPTLPDNSLPLYYIDVDENAVQSVTPVATYQPDGIIHVGGDGRLKSDPARLSYDSTNQTVRIGSGTSSLRLSFLPGASPTTHTGLVGANNLTFQTANAGIILENTRGIWMLPPSGGAFRHFTTNVNDYTIFSSDQPGAKYNFKLATLSPYTATDVTGFQFGYKNRAVFGDSLVAADSFPSALVAMKSITKGFLPPRMTTTQRDNISSPAEGLWVHNSTTHELNYFDGSSWISLSGGGGSGFITAVQSNVFKVIGTTLYLQDTLDGVHTPKIQFFTGKDGAFRGGVVSGDQWDETNVGNASVSLGINTKASANYSFAAGDGSEATGIASVAVGSSTDASGDYSFAAGASTHADGSHSTASGNSTMAQGAASFAGGLSTVAAGAQSFATGNSSVAFGASSFAANYSTTANGDYSTALGFNTTAGPLNSLVVGRYNASIGSTGDSSYLFAIGNGYNNLSKGNALTVKYDTTIIENIARFASNGTPASGKVPTGTDANGNWTWQTPSSGSVSPAYFDWIGSGQSNMSGRDVTIGNWVYSTNSRVLSFDSSNKFAVANPAINNICYSDAATIVPRNNTAWQFALNWAHDNLTDTARLIVEAVGSMGSCEWTPATTGQGEVTNTNTRLTALMTKLSNAPSNFKAKGITMQYGEQDAVTGNLIYFLNNVCSFYDTLRKHAKCDTNIVMELVYPITDQPINGDSLRRCLDSIYYRTKDIGNRYIIAVPHNYPGTAAGHPSNDTTDLIGRACYSEYLKRFNNGPIKPDTTLVKRGSGYYYLAGNPFVVNSTTQINSNYPLQVASTSTSNSVALKRTDGTGQGLNIGLGNNTATGLSFQHVNNSATSNYLFMNDTSFQYQNSAGTTKFLVGDNATLISQPLTVSNNALYTGTELRNTGVYFGRTSASDGQIVAMVASSSVGASSSVDFKSGSSNNGAPTARIRCESGSSGGILQFWGGNYSTYSKYMTLDQTGRLAISSTITVPTALLHIGSNSTSASHIRLQGGVNPASPNKGDIWQDTTATNPIVKYNDGTNTTILAKTLTNTATLDFGSTAAGTSTDLTITVTGAADGDAVSVGVPNGSTSSNGSFTAWVSATNTVTVRFSNNSLVSSIDPASGTFRVSVIKY